MAMRALLQCLVLLAIIGCCSCAASTTSRGAPQNLQIHPFGNETTDGEEDETDNNEEEKTEEQGGEEKTEEQGEPSLEEHTGANDTARHPDAADQCWTGRGFATREKCYQICKDPEAVDETSSGDVKVVALMLAKGEFSVKNGRLTVDVLKQREFEEFTLKDGRALVCLDVSDKFKTCNPRDIIDHDKYEQLGNFSLKTKVHEEVHDIGNYFITNTEAAFVCLNKHNDKRVTNESTGTEPANNGALALFPQLTVTMIILWEMLAIIVPFL